MASNSATTTLSATANTGIKGNLNAYFNETGTNTANNTSTVYCRAQMTATGGSNWSGQNNTLRIYWHDNRENYDRLVASGAFGTMSANGTHTVEGTITVTHNADGTLSGYAYATWERHPNYPNTYAPRNGGVSTAWTGMTTIPRASQPSIKTWPNNSPDFYIGETIQIHMNRASSSFTHTVVFNYGDKSKTIATGVTDSCEFDTSTLKSEIYALMPNATSVGGTITVTTYSGSTNVGSKSCNWNGVAVAEEISPTFSNFTYKDNYFESVSVTDNDQLMIGKRSVLLATISSANKATAKQSATIKRYVATFNGQTITKSYSSGTVTFEFDVTANNTSQSLEIRAEDSRGYTATVRKSITVIPYSTPTMIVSAKRLNNFENTTTLSFSGTFAPIVINGSPRNHPWNLTWFITEKGKSPWGSPDNIVVDGVITDFVEDGGKWSCSDVIVSLDNTKAYDLTVWFDETAFLGGVTAEKSISEGIPIFRIGTDGYVYNQEQRLATETKITDAITQALLDKVYPVGSIYISMVNKSPQTFLGGTWSRIAQGRTLVGLNTSETEFNTIRKTGGSKTHTLTVNEMPSHNHPLNGNTDYVGIDGTGGSAYGLLQGGNNYRWKIGQMNVGGGAAHNNLQPYITTYMWERTA